ncbi:methyl-accepting chemotaxis protein [Achromobacter sp. NPDC058515]|uniref:methyl-accepting chemotaxis protein n=1 Tax=Achromobacter sp. NPDC058515 TaxID=3346533 RepID=UPI0036560D59
MRTNLPVTQLEYDYADDATLMSTTDTESHITYANAAFIQVSGFDEEEILLQAHNMVRHPDMPVEAFADMWRTLKSGKSWTAVVKNRRKNGDHYWVRANATPVVREGKLVGYMSVRTRPKRVEVEAAEKFYRALAAGKSRGRGFHQGLIVRKGLMGWTSVLQTMPTRWRILCGLLGLCAWGVGAAAWLGISGTTLAQLAGTMAIGCAMTALWLGRQISRPLEKMLAQAQSVASGQAGENIDINRSDDIGMLMRSINQAGLNLRSLVDDVSEQIDGVGRVSVEISQGTEELNKRTEQSTDNLQRTAAAMDQMTASIGQNAQAAREAESLAIDATDAAAKGGAVIKRVVGTMAEIASASHKINDIIGVIDSIAFQTNILALNAAVEAARAGKEGKGFAVVAGEVRSLAQRSATAAKEIKDLINANVAKVEAGSALVNEGGAAVSDIVLQVERVARLIKEISHATTEQARGIQQVNHAMTQLDQTTQQNALLTEQSIATAENLRRRSGRLARAVEVFSR